MARAGRKFQFILVGMVAAFLVLVALVYTVLLVSSAAAQVGEVEADEGCANPQVVETFSGTENQRTPQFEITGDTFRLTYNVEMTGPKGFPVFGTDVLGENGQPIGVDQRSFLTFEEDGILAGPGVFALEIRAYDVSYEITVKDCNGADNGGNGNGGSATDQIEVTGVTEKKDSDLPLMPESGLYFINDEQTGAERDLLDCGDLVPIENFEGQRVTVSGIPQTQGNPPASFPNPNEIPLCVTAIELAEVVTSDQAVVTPDQAVVTPDQGVQVTLLPDAGGLALLPIAGAGLVAGGLLGMRLRRR